MRFFTNPESSCPANKNIGTTHDFLKLVFIAVILSILIAYIATSRWLDNFAYHIELSWLKFAVSGFVALFIAAITVAISAAKADPAESIRYE